MSIIVKDETAGVIILTIDNAGNMCFGDGTPINRLTLDGYGLIDNNGFIIHGGTSATVSAVTGAVNMSPTLSGTTINTPFVTISTLSGRTPMVQLDGQYPRYWLQKGLSGSPSDPDSFPVENFTFFNNSACMLAVPFSGGFFLENANTYFDGSDVFINPSSDYFDITLTEQVVGYRWL